ncbi:GAF and ANTAR domain-containing protein [Actinomycetospora straminea]|uniref:GAF and ANTAR domain-containing protein n=1 Tax=Actinomycetospora straminea TaxID=663607 RepID=A0ABP9EXG9_9PSEU|nr:GAF and ANTAR domain-containing protein [Actinomycetospora straminea]MDD7935819.1 GAF and ANTAR domain-containing protein [Actinomycetospora straminea]
MTGSEVDWDAERRAFAAEHATERAQGHDAYPASGAAPSGGPRLGLLSQAVGELTRVLLATPDGGGVNEVLERVVDLGARVVPAADVVSVTLRRGGRDGYSTPAYSDQLAVRIDQAQYRHEEGPCVRALEAGGLGVAGSDDLAHDGQWPRFGPAAAALGVGSVFAVGLFPVGEKRPLRGALNFYRRGTGGFGQADREAGLLLAAHVSTALAYVSVTEASQLRDVEFQTALDSRDVIGQAKGILMERRGLPADEAFDVLRRASQDLNVKLRDVASTLAERRADL